MDELATALKLDPLELRLRNYAEIDPDTGKPFSSKELRACYKQGAARFGWSKRRLEPRAMRDGDWLVGYGMATASYPAHMRGSSASAKLKADGSALVQAGTHDLGTGAYTVLTQIAADELGLGIGQVRVELGDTDLPEAPLAAGSQTSASVGSAVKQAAALLRNELVALAVADGPLQGVSATDVEVEAGAVVSKDRAKRDPFVDILRRANKPELLVKVETKEKPERQQVACHSFGAQFVEVRVDELTGEIRVARALGAFAGGRILNAKTARSQLLGGIVWGIGLALMESTERDERTGRVVTRDLADYHVPVHADVPPIDVIMVPEVDTVVSDVGAKGLGELGITGVAAAIANAIHNATGHRIRDLPIRLDRLV
jgi:xanthine dehydrogenase YagR molybdenum-binding subunit